MKTCVLVLLLSIPLRLFACTCSNFATLEQTVAATELIAGIEIIALDTLKVKAESKTRAFDYYAKYTIRLIEKFKGQQVGDTLTVYTTFSEPSCGHVFKLGEKYILFAGSTPFNNPDSRFPVGKNIFWTDTCTYPSYPGMGKAQTVRNALNPGADKVIPVKLHN